MNKRNKRISRAVKKAWSLPGARAKRSKSMRKAKTKIVKQKTSASMSRFWLNPKNRQLASKKSILAWKRPASRKRQSEARRQQWKKPEYARKMKIIIRKNWKKWEHKVRKSLEKQGWLIIDRGWPDFICLKGKKVKFVETKDARLRLTAEQKKVHIILRKLGLIVEVLASQNF